MPFINAAIKAINKGSQVAKTFKAGKAAQAKKPAPKPTPKAAPRPVVVKKPVAVIPAPANPPAKPAPKPKPGTMRVFGYDVPTPVVYVGGTLGALFLIGGVAKAVK